jgi:hypothetical protein
MPMPRSSLTECCVGLDVMASELDPHLADGLEERQRFDVADRAADFDHAHVRIPGAHADPVFDLVGDVRNHLHGRSQIVAAALLGDDPLVDPARGEIAVAARGRAYEAFVVPEIEIGLGPVRSHEYFAMLEGAHGAGVHVDIRIELHHAHFESACLQDGAQGRRCDALAERGNYATGDENKSSHDGSPPIKYCHERT